MLYSEKLFSLKQKRIEILMIEKKEIEILAPCGSMYALDAAISAGADACYLAGTMFGARAFAANFEADALLNAVEKAHEYGVKIYLTVNTLLKNNEIEDLRRFLSLASDAGVDALLIQDLGVVNLVKREFKNLKIHASTQMNIMTPEGAMLMKNEGFERIVAAREMNLKQLSEIKKNVPIQLEAFVHGAMCFCYSGRCLMSSFYGGRSGNRGRCAQPCRQRYDGKYKMSMKGMCTLKDVPQLINSGVDSLKIEGRMKNEYYVAATVEAYREMRDDVILGCFSEEKALTYEKRLADIFNRGGFSEGYLKESTQSGARGKLTYDKTPGTIGIEVGKVTDVHNGYVNIKAKEDINKGDNLKIDTEKGIVQLTSGIELVSGKSASFKSPGTKNVHNGMSVVRMRNAALQKELENKYLSGLPKIHISGKVICHYDKPVSVLFKIEDKTLKNKEDDILVIISGCKAEKALKAPVTDEDLKKTIAKLGNTEFEICEIEIDNDGESFVRLGEIAELKRKAIILLREKLRKRALCENVQETLKKEIKYSDVNFHSKGKTDKIIKSNLRKFIYSFADEKQINEFKKEFEKEVSEGIINKDDSICALLDLGFGEEILDKWECCYNWFAERNIELLIGLPHIRKNPNSGELSAKILNLMQFDNMQKFGFYVRNIDDFAWLTRNIKDINKNITKCDKDNNREKNSECIINYNKEDNIECNKKINRIILSPTIYAYNDEAVEWLYMKAEEVASDVSFVAPLELTGEEIFCISYPEKADVYYPVYGKIPLMITDAWNINKSGYDRIYIHSDHGGSFQVYPNSDMCYNTILSEKPLDLRNSNIGNMGSFVSFTDDNSCDVRNVMRKIFLTSDISHKNYNTEFVGHFEKGIM